MSQKPLRIALTGYRSAPFSGGQGVYLRYLSRALARAGHQVTVISGPPYPHLDDDIRLVELPSLDLYQHGLKSVKLRQLFDKLSRIEWLSKLTGGFVEPWTFGERLRKWVLDHRDEFDIVHDNQSIADGVLDLQRAGIPVVTTIHHPITRDLRLALDSESAWYMRALLRRWHSFLGMQGHVARQLNSIVTVSSLSRKDIIADFGVQPGVIRVLHNGVDTTLFRPQPEVSRRPYQLMATASADAPLKGLQVLLRALGRLVNDFPEVELLLVAKPRPGGDTEKLIAKLQLASRVHFVSDVEDSAMVRHYAESTIAVVPSLYEGFGLPAVEAMACGMPLVSSDGGALAEVVADGGVLVPAGDDEALAREIAVLLRDSDRRMELARIARHRAESNFSWDVCAATLVDHYRELLSKC